MLLQQLGAASGWFLALDGFYAQVDRLITKYKDSVVWLGNLSKSSWRGTWRRARVCLPNAVEDHAGVR